MSDDKEITTVSGANGSKKDSSGAPSSSLKKSYHVFIYPFTFDVNNQCTPSDEECSKAALEDALKSNKWSKMTSLDAILQNADLKDENRRQQYAVYRYFLPKASDNIFNMDSKSDDCSIYTKDGASGSVYEIQVPDKSTYSLRIEEIRLTIYKKLNIGLISFRMNLDDGKIEDIKKANQFGRRLFMPFYSNSEANSVPSCSLTAERICIKWKDSSDPLVLTETAQTATSVKVTKDADALSGLSDLIFGKESIDHSQKWNRYHLTGILDDRMFTCCLIRDQSLSDHIGKHADKVVEDFFESPATALKNADESHLKLGDINPEYDELYDTLYSILYIDDAEPSCQDRAMERQKLSEQFDTRWTRYGTIHGLTEYSMICITGEPDFLQYNVIEPFLNEYTELARLGLAQVAAIHQQEKEIEEINEKIDPGKRMSDETIESINKAWKKYTLFQNDMFIPEVTFQEQGRELYDLIKKSFRLNSLNEYLNYELEHLHALAGMEADIASKESDSANAEANDRISYSINIMTVLGTGLALLALLQDSFGVRGVFGNQAWDFGYRVLIFFIYASGTLIITFGYGHMNPKVQKCKKNEEQFSDNKLIFTFLILLIIGIVLSLIRCFNPGM